MPISEEEQNLLNRIIECRKLAGKKLDEREQEVARLMVSRGLLNTLVEGNRVFFVANGLPDLWRW